MKIKIRLFLYAYIYLRIKKSFFYMICQNFYAIATKVENDTQIIKNKVFQ